MGQRQAVNATRIWKGGCIRARSRAREHWLWHLWMEVGQPWEVVMAVHVHSGDPDYPWLPLTSSSAPQGDRPGQGRDPGVRLPLGAAAATRSVPQHGQGCWSGVNPARTARLCPSLHHQNQKAHPRCRSRLMPTRAPESDPPLRQPRRKDSEGASPHPQPSSSPCVCALGRKQPCGIC